MRTVVPELVVLDLRIPDLSGQEVVASVRHSPTLWQTPVLIITAHLEDLGDQPLGLTSSAGWRNPVEVVTFLRAVERALAQYEPQ
jgi:two-component system cell cycle response regulator DivK